MFDDYSDIKTEFHLTKEHASPRYLPQQIENRCLNKRAHGNIIHNSQRVKPNIHQLRNGKHIVVYPHNTLSSIDRNEVPTHEPGKHYAK